MSGALPIQNAREAIGIEEEPVGLNELTRLRLSEFQRRRWLLSDGRLASWMLLVCLLALLLAIFLDALFLNPLVRTLGSLAFYLLLAVAATVFGYCRWRRSSDLGAEALRLEQLAPDLRERLLSAVELGQTATATAGSAAFQKRLQSSVAGELRLFNMHDVLPWQLIQRSVLLAGAAISFFAVLCCLPFLNLPQRISRILFPVVDVGRVSDIAIHIDQPLPHSKVVPASETLLVIARPVGIFRIQEDLTLWLETRSSSGIERTQMLREGRQPTNDRIALDDDTTGFPATALAKEPGFAKRASANRFEVVLAIDGDGLDYRVIGGGAETAWHRLTAKPRPQVIEQRLEITPPAYVSASTLAAELPAAGEFSVVIGSQISMQVQSSIGEVSAQVLWLDSEKPAIQDVDLEANQSNASNGQKVQSANTADQLRKLDNGHWSATFQADVSRSFRVSLRDLETDYANIYAPASRMVVVPDQPPQIQWLAPEQMNLVAANDDVLQFRARVTDQWSVQPLVQILQINDRDLKSIEMAVSETDSNIESIDHKIETSQSNVIELIPQYEKTITWQLDLLPLGLEAGDRISVKLACMDQAQQTGESPVLTILISQTAQGFQSLAVAPLEAQRRQIAETLNELALAAFRINTNLHENPDAQTDPQFATQAKQFAQQIRNASARAQEQIQQALALGKADGANRISSRELMRTGEALADLQTHRAAKIDEVANDKNAVDSESADLVQHLYDAAKAAEALAEEFRTVVTHDAVSRHAGQLAELSRVEKQLVASAREEGASAEQLVRQQRVLRRQIADVRQSIVDSLPHVRPEAQRQMQNVTDRLGDQLRQSEQADQSLDLINAERLAESLASGLLQLSQPSQLDGGLALARQKSQQRLGKLAATAADSVARHANELSGKPSNSRVSAATADLAVRRELQRIAEHGDRRFASDLGNAMRAIEQHDRVSGSSSELMARTLGEIGEALRTLDVVNAVREANLMLGDLQNHEQALGSDQSMRWSSPRAWDAFLIELDRARSEFRKSKLPAEVRGKLLAEIERAVTSKAAQRIKQKLSERQWNMQSTSAAAEAQELGEAMKTIQKLFDEQAQLARAKLDQLAPDIGQLARRAALQTKQLEQRTKDLSNSLSKDEVPNKAAQIEQLQSDAEQMEKPLDTLREALVDRADSQNLLDKTEVSIARHADAALDVVDSAEHQLTQSLDAVSTEQQSAEQAQSLALASETQAAAAQTLEELAEQFDTLKRAEQNEVDRNALQAELSQLAERLSQLAAEPAQDDGLQTPNVDSAKSSEQAMPTAEANADNYERAEKLADLAESDPQELLERLEAELRDDSQMQAEMSQIARQAAEQARDRLVEAATQQAELNPALEASDPYFRAQRMLLEHELQSVRSATSQMLTNLITEARSISNPDKENNSQQRFADTEQSLRDALLASSTLDAKTQTLNEMRDRAHLLQQSLASAEDQLNSAEAELLNSSDQIVHENEADLSNRQREMNDRQRRIQQQVARSMQNAERSEQQRLKQAEADLKEADKRVQQAAQQALTTRDKLEAAPTDALQDELNLHEQKLVLARNSVEGLQKLVNAIVRRQSEAKADVDRANRADRQRLTAQNPSAELAMQLSAQAAEQTQSLAAQLQRWVAATELQSKPVAEQLRTAAVDENEIRQSVSAATDTLERAARHEERLQNSAASQKLRELTQAIDDSAAADIDQAQQQLLNAENDATTNGSKTNQASPPVAAAAQDSLDTAESSLRTAVSAIEAMLASEAESKSPASSVRERSVPERNSQEGNSDSSDSSPSSTNDTPLSAAQKAKMIDELDQLLHRAAEASSDAQAQQSQSTGSPTSESESTSGQPTADQDASTAEGQTAQSPSQPQPGSQSQTNESGGAPASLSEVAQQLAKNMSRARQPASESKPSSTGSKPAGTESQNADTNPQPAVAVRVIPVERLDGNWGQLREQAAEEIRKEDRESVLPRFRRQVEAYFRELSERGGQIEN